MEGRERVGFSIWSQQQLLVYQARNFEYEFIQEVLELLRVNKKRTMPLHIIPKAVGWTD